MGQVKGIFRDLAPFRHRKSKSRRKNGTNQRNIPRSCPIQAQKKQALEGKWDKSKEYSAILSHLGTEKASRGGKMGQVKGIFRDLAPFNHRKSKPWRENGTSQRFFCDLVPLRHRKSKPQRQNAVLRFCHVLPCRESYPPNGHTSYFLANVILVGSAGRLNCYGMNDSNERFCGGCTCIP